MKWRTVRGKSHVSEYERDSQGRLRVGSTCFTGPLLKKRLSSEAEVDDWIKSHPSSSVQSYPCHMCGGWHLTGRPSEKPKPVKKTKKKSRKRGM